MPKPVDEPNPPDCDNAENPLDPPKAEVPDPEVELKPVEDPKPPVVEPNPVEEPNAADEPNPEDPWSDSLPKNVNLFDGAAGTWGETSD